MNDLMDNTPKDQKAPSIPNAGVETGVTDTYGGGLTDGYQNPKPISKDDMNSHIGFC